MGERSSRARYSENPFAGSNSQFNPVPAEVARHLVVIFDSAEEGRRLPGEVTDGDLPASRDSVACHCTCAQPSPTEDENFDPPPD